MLSLIVHINSQPFNSTPTDVTRLMFKRSDIPHPHVNTVEDVYQIDVTEMECSQNRPNWHTITNVSA